MTDATSNAECRERLAAHLAARREARTMRLELADNLFLVAIDTLEHAAKLRTIGEDDAPKLAEMLEDVAARMERLELDMRGDAQTAIEDMAAIAQRGHLAARDRDLGEILAGLAGIVKGEPAKDPDYVRLERIKAIVQAERRRLEELSEPPAPGRA